MTEPALCPATMCPLTAPNGSPWTGEKNAVCPESHAKCGWYRDGCGCEAANGAHEQVGDAADGRPVVVLGPNKPRREEKGPRRTYDCPRAHECQWQRQAEAEGGICPPRSALALGLDPRLALF